MGILSWLQGRRVKITAPVTDAAFVPVGYDLITASFSSNGFSASAPTQGAPRGRAESHVSAGWLFSCHRAAFLSHWHDDDGTNGQTTPTANRPTPLCPPCSASVMFTKEEPPSGATLAAVASTRKQRQGQFQMAFNGCLADLQMSLYLLAPDV